MPELVADMAVEGSHAHATRRALGAIEPESAVWDHWVLRHSLSPNDATHYVLQTVDEPSVLMPVVLLRIYSGWPVEVSRRLVASQRYHFTMRIPLRRPGRPATRDDVAYARELTRHLVRNVANGNLPRVPLSTEDSVAWWAASGVAALFIERFGRFESALGESTMSGHSPLDDA